MTLTPPNTDAHRFYCRAFISSMEAGAGATALIWYILGEGPAMEYLIFLVWSLLNLLVWSASFKEFLEHRRIPHLASLVVAKVLWLGVFVGILLCLKIENQKDFMTFLLGLNTPLLVLMGIVFRSWLVDGKRR